MPPGKVVVAMSGGVDSSIAAAILQSQDYQVIGVTMQIWSADKETERLDGCCGMDAIESAKRVAYKLGIPHYVIDFRDVFTEKVIAPFCNEYSLGRTPNPCVRCNRHIKFSLLLDKAAQVEANYLATGHYARIEASAEGYRLLKGVDQIKDQSYFLYTLGQKELKQLLFPLGHLHKSEVKRMAAELGLPCVNRPESQDICFVSDNSYHAFVSKHISLQPGDIVDSEGKVLGRHKGLALYTVGQRQGLSIASNGRRYVLKLDAKNNRVVIGSKEQLLKSRLLASQLSWVAGNTPAKTTGITAKVRYQTSEAPVTLNYNDGIVEVEFHQPQMAIAPGQSIVFYQGDIVLGGGIIEDAA